MKKITRGLLALAEELRLPPEALPPLAAARTTREACRRAGVSDGIFLDTMGCFPRFLRETRELPGDTRLQRAVKARPAAGGTVGSAWGALRKEVR